MHAKSLQSCPILCDPMDYSPPGSSVHGVLQARILEWVAIPSSKGFFPVQGLNLGLLYCMRASLVAQLVKNSPTMQGVVAESDMTEVTDHTRMHSQMINVDDKV